MSRLASCVQQVFYSVLVQESRTFNATGGLNVLQVSKSAAVCTNECALLRFSRKRKGFICSLIHIEFNNSFAGDTSASALHRKTREEAHRKTREETHRRTQKEETRIKKTQLQTERRASALYIFYTS